MLEKMYMGLDDGKKPLPPPGLLASFGYTRIGTLSTKNLHEQQGWSVCHSLTVTGRSAIDTVGHRPIGDHEQVAQLFRAGAAEQLRGSRVGGSPCQ
jgi:hypothetical protein